MTANSEMPYVIVAAVCERVLQEKDNVLSAIRLVDMVTFNPTGENPPEEMPAFTTNVTALLSFRSGPAQGQRTVQIKLIKPNGELSEIKSGESEFSVVFNGEGHGVNLIIRMSIDFTLPGLHWFDVTINGKVITRIPLKVAYGLVQVSKVIPNQDAGKPDDD